MADAVNEAELGRSKQGTSPREHLWHLLSIGWNAQSPLIERYVQDNGLRTDLEEWQRNNNDTKAKAPAKQKR